MASKALKQWKADPGDLFPYRGQYGSKLWAATFFLFTRSLLLIFAYSILVPSNSFWSLFSRFPGAAPSRPPYTGALSLPGIPDVLLRTVENALGMPSFSSLIFLSILMNSIVFAFANTLWRRERFPMTGQGGGLVISAQVQIVDLVHILLFVYTSSLNPTWSPALFRWMPLFIFSGEALQFVADHSKYLFRQNPWNDGKIYTGGLFNFVRHPNFLGFFVWRVAFATACGGLILGVAVFAMFVNLFVQTSVPGLEGYLSAKYGKQWNLFKDRVKWKIFPGVY